MTALELINKIIPMIANQGDKNIKVSVKLYTSEDKSAFAMHLIDLRDIKQSNTTIFLQLEGIE